MALLRIGRLVLDTVAREIHEQGKPLDLEPRAYDLLVYLVDNRDRPVPKVELLDKLWAGREVTDGVLTQAVNKVRRALGGETQEFVRTLHRVGYRFVGRVELADESDEQGATVFLAGPSGQTGRFTTASDALQQALEERASDSSRAQGIAAIEAAASEARRAQALQIAEWLAGLARPGQILLTASAFDFARVAMDPDRAANLTWLAHGVRHFGAEGLSLMIFEVADRDAQPMLAPPGADSDEALQAADVIPGWRAAQGLIVPGRTDWVLETSLGEGGYGEAWLAVNQLTGEPRVFKFCYDGQRLRSLQREVTLLRLLREVLGEREDIAGVLDWNFSAPPYFIETQFSAHGDLSQWARREGGLRRIPMDVRLNVVAQVATALAAAHQAGVLHKDIKPQNVLVSESPNHEVRVALSDFGIGLLTGAEPLGRYDITELGVTDALVGDLASARSGTPRYIAPELLEGGAATAQSDIYSLGVLLYQMVVGDFERVVAPGWERGVDDPVLRDDLANLLDRDPARRPNDPSVVADGIANLEQRRAARLASMRNRKRRTALGWGAGIATVLAVIAAAIFWPREATVLPPSPGLSNEAMTAIMLVDQALEPGVKTASHELKQSLSDALSSTRGLRVVQSAAALATDEELLVGRDLEVDYVVTLAGKAVTIRTPDGEEYWQRSIDLETGAPLQTQRDIIESVRTVLAAAPRRSSDYENIDENAVFGKLAVDQRRWLQAFERLKGANPSDPRDTRTKALAELYTISGYLSHAEAVYEQALESQRTDIQVMNQKAAHLYELQGNDAAMLARAQAAARAGSGRAGFYFAANALRRGEIEFAIEAQNEALNRLGNRTDWVERVYRAIGDPGLVPDALEYLGAADAELLLQEKQFFLQYGLLGATEPAIRALERGIGQPEFILTFVWLPEMAHVRRHPRFVDLMARYGLVDVWRAFGTPDRCVRQENRYRCE